MPDFYKSELTINGASVQETLFYKADQDYHTLYRNFQSPLAALQENISNSIAMGDVGCDKGTPYFNAGNNCYNNNSLNPADCLSYTENNEYGCSFGDTYGFLKDENYKISANYKINPENLFKTDGKYYIKFIAYGENWHKNLVLGGNFIIEGEAVADRKYSC